MSTILLCTDGSEIASEAVKAGLDLLTPADRVIVVTVTDGPDPTLLSGASGFSGGVVTPEEFDTEQAAATGAAESVAARSAAALGVSGAETKILEGDPGGAICSFAAEVGADAIVMGSRGRGGFKRAVLGSVSDHVVRHAPCTVVITGAAAD